MIETILAIAMLCSVNYEYIKVTDEYQLKCQQYYVKCVKEKKLEQCVLDRKVKFGIAFKKE